ncbi:MAG TPA: potassium channel family protein [Pseudogracilibacillus sp.]|nr:potassium channel family protein [Pseudogracilibacillus sp.]
MKILFICILLTIIMISMVQFLSFTYKERAKKSVTSISLEIFYTLLLIYVIVILGFGLIYFLLSFYKQTLIDNASDTPVSLGGLLLRCFYFSGVTLLTIGYGDITPLGIGRFIAIVQSLIGYLLPTAFVLKIVHLNIERQRTP